MIAGIGKCNFPVIKNRGSARSPTRNCPKKTIENSSHARFLHLGRSFRSSILWQSSPPYNIPINTCAHPPQGKSRSPSNKGLSGTAWTTDNNPPISKQVAITDFLMLNFFRCFREFPRKAGVCFIKICVSFSHNTGIVFLTQARPISRSYRAPIGR